MNIKNHVNVHMGPLPPPIGGISVYLYRLSKTENNSIFIDESIFKTKYSQAIWIIKQIISRQRKHYIYHSPSLKKRLMFYFLSIVTLHKFSIVIHGQSIEDSYTNSNFLLKFLIKRMLIKAEFIQVVNSHIRNFLTSLNINKKKIKIKNAFIPPPLDEEDIIFKGYPQELLTFITNRHPFLIANAASLVFYQDTDLYGLDMCIELTAKLKETYPNIGFLFALANDKENKTYLTEMKDRIKKLGIEENFLFMTGQKELWPLFKKADLMIRPTNTDGDALSIREALYFNCPAIASDVCQRPEGTVLFETRDMDDLFLKVKKVFNETM